MKRYLFDTKEEALAWAEQEGLDMRYLEAYQGPFLGDTTWVIGVWSGDDEE